MDLLKITYVLLLPEEVFLINNMYLPGMASNFPSYIYIYIYKIYFAIFFCNREKNAGPHFKIDSDSAFNVKQANHKPQAFIFLYMQSRELLIYLNKHFSSL